MISSDFIRRLIMAKGENLPVDERAKIYTIFSRLYQKDVDTILDKLQTKCSDVDFVGKYSPFIEKAIKMMFLSLLCSMDFLKILEKEL